MDRNPAQLTKCDLVHTMEHQGLRASGCVAEINVGVEVEWGLMYALELVVGGFGVVNGGGRSGSG